MYTSVNLDAEADETRHDLAEATVQELFKPVSSTRSTRETDTPKQATPNQLSAAGNSDISDLDAVMTCVYHTLEYMPLEEDLMFSPYSFQVKWNKMTSLALNMLS